MDVAQTRVSLESPSSERVRKFYTLCWHPSRVGIHDVGPIFLTSVRSVDRHEYLCCSHAVRPRHFPFSERLIMRRAQLLCGS